MMYLRRAFVLLSAAACVIFAGGCYTRIATYQGEVTESGSKGGCGDCRDEVPYTGGRQVCVWERDIFGYPEVRCYYTGYASSWLYFHNTPWWYRSSYGWRDTRGCPPYYYYDRFSGVCRYYGGGSYSRPNPGTGGGGGGAVAGSERPRPHMRGITAGEPSSTESSESSVGGGGGLPPMFSGGANKSLSPVGAPSSPPPPAYDSDAGMTKPQQGGEGRPSNPPEQRQEERKPVDKNERPRPSMRGI